MYFVLCTPLLPWPTIALGKQNKKSFGLSLGESEALRREISERGTKPRDKYKQFQTEPLPRSGGRVGHVCTCMNGVRTSLYGIHRAGYSFPDDPFPECEAYVIASEPPGPSGYSLLCPCWLSWKCMVGAQRLKKGCNGVVSRDLRVSELFQSITHVLLGGPGESLE